MNQSPEIKGLIELLIEADPDSLIDEYPHLLTPDQLWRASGESMADALKHIEGRKEVIDFLIAQDPEEFISEFEGKWEPELLERMVSNHPDECLEYLTDEMSPSQIERCIGNDLVRAADLVPEKLTDEQVEKVAETSPETALSALHSRLDDKTFQRVAAAHPELAWYTEPHRLNQEFLASQLFRDAKARRVHSAKLSESQVAEFIKNFPEFTWDTNLKLLDVKKVAEKGNNQEGCPTKRCCGKFLLFIIGLAIGIAGTILIFMGSN